MPVVLSPCRLPAIAVLVSVSCLSIAAQAHTDADDPTGLSVSLNLATSWRSQDQLSQQDIDDEQVWQIPGLLMGGHAISYREGTSLDESSLQFRYVTDDQSYALVKLGSHAGTEPSFENALIGQKGEWFGQSVRAEAGAMTGFFSPTNHLHPSTHPFSLSPLGFSALLGGHVQDTGVRVALGDPAQGWSAGTESYQGNVFPAGGGKGLYSAFVRHADQNQSFDWQLQGWGLRAQARNRQDDRSASNSHSHSSTTSTAFDGYFDGTTNVMGLFAELGWNSGSRARLSLTGEYLNARVTGDVRDADNTQTIQLDGDYQSLMLMPALDLGNHQLALRYETLSLDNHLTGSAVSTLGPEAGLINEGHNPQRLSAAWIWQTSEAISLRLEWMKDQALPDHQPQVFTLGLIWRGELIATPDDYCGH